MKVFLGKHRSWIGPYQIASALCFWARPVKDELGYENEPDWVHDFGTWLAEDRNGNDSWLCKLLGCILTTMMYGQWIIPWHLLFIPCCYDLKHRSTVMA